MPGRLAAALLPLLIVLLPLLPASAVAAPKACQPHPLGGRDLYLRGSFNSWNAVETQRFIWVCTRFELVTRIEGEHRFKVADESWSADADLGGRIDALALRGAEMQRRFVGTHRFTLDRSLQVLSIDDCPKPAPFGETVLFLRGTMNNWAALDDYAFRYHCDAYYLNLKLEGRHEFKLADAGWKDATSFGVGGGNHVQVFDGEHTVRLSFDETGRHRLHVGPKSFADPQAKAVDHPLALGLRFDSRDLAHKRPFGAQPAGTAMQFAVRAPKGVQQLTLVLERRRFEGNQEVLEYTEAARIPMARETAGDGDRWTAGHRFDDVGIHGYWFEALIEGRIFVLQNNAEAVFWTREKGGGGIAAVTEKPLSPRSIRRFRQTVFAPGFKVPDWAADAVWYQVFPERFRNGNPANDPVPGRDRYHQHTVEKHADWNSRPYRPGSGDGSDAHFNNDFFGGDLAGLIDKLDHIRDLGANAIYLTPVFRASSNHKYDTADYREVDPAFGTNADFERLTREAAKRGIRVVTDTSLNHTGADSVYFDRYGNFRTGGAFEGSRIRPSSPYAGWYSFDAAQANPDRQFKGWTGVTDLPELDKSSRAWRDFAYGAPDSVMKLWLDRGAAGWRMDVAPWVPDDFWREWRAAIKAHRPDAITIAETWFDAAKYFLGDSFDSTMNYIFRNTVLAYAAGGDARRLVHNLELMREHYPPQAFHALMNLLSSHYQARSLHVLGWHDERNPAQERLAKDRFRLALFFQMTYPGAPAVYYGDEVGVTGGDDPDNRRTYPWADQGGQPDLVLEAEVKRLIRLRHELPVLRRGELGAPLLVDANVMVLPRRLGKVMAITASNNAPETRTVTVAVPADAPGAFVDAVDGRPVPLRDGHLLIDLPPHGGQVLIAR
jgi:glycosidase